MTYIEDITDNAKERQWDNFEKTGSVISYLEYKGIHAGDVTSDSLRGRIYWHSSTPTELSQKKLNTETPPEF